MGAARALAFSSDGQWLASGGSDGQVKIWDLASGQEIHRLTNGYWGTLALAFSPDGTRLAVSAAQGIRLLDTRTWSEEDAVALTERGTESLRFSPDGRRLMAAGKAGVGFWQVEEIAAQPEQWRVGASYWNNPGQHACALSSEGRFLAHAASAGAMERMGAIMNR